MIGGALAFPFLLLRRKPVTVLLCLLISVVLGVAIDFADMRLSTLNGVTEVQDYYVWRQVAYYLLRTAALGAPAALVLTQAVIVLGRRDADRKFNPLDAVRFIGVALLYVLVFVLPLTVLNFYLIRWFTASVMYLSPLLSLGQFVVGMLILCLFALVWSDVIARERFALFHTLKVTGRRYWRVLGIVGPLVIITVLVDWGARWGGWFAYTLLPQSLMQAMSDDPASTSPYWLTNVATAEIGQVFSTYLLSVGNAYLYSRLMPERPERVAEMF